MAKKSKKKKPARAAKAKRSPAKKKKATKRPAKKAKRAVAAKKRPAKKKKARRAIGEGNYAAAREFDRKQQAFVRANKTRIPRLGKEAEAALEGPEGAELMRAEESARGHSHE